VKIWSDCSGGAGRGQGEGKRGVSTGFGGAAEARGLTVEREEDGEGEAELRGLQGIDSALMMRMAWRSQPSQAWLTMSGPHKSQSRRTALSAAGWSTCTILVPIARKSRI